MGTVLGRVCPGEHTGLSDLNRGYQSLGVYSTISSLYLTVNVVILKSDAFGYYQSLSREGLNHATCNLEKSGASPYYRSLVVAPLILKSVLLCSALRASLVKALVMQLAIWTILGHRLTIVNVWPWRPFHLQEAHRTLVQAENRMIDKSVCARHDSVDFDNSGSSCWNQCGLNTARWGADQISISIELVENLANDMEGACEAGASIAEENAYSLTLF